MEIEEYKRPMHVVLNIGDKEIVVTQALHRFSDACYLEVSSKYESLREEIISGLEPILQGPEPKMKGPLVFVEE